MKKNLIFFLYHLGLSKYSLSKLFKYYDIEVISKISDGDYLEYAISENLFLKKDIDLLSNPEMMKKKRDEADRFLSKFEKNEVSFYFYYEKKYPKLLRNIGNPPFVLFMRGNINILNDDRTISIVGSRTILEDTKKNINHVVKELVEQKFTTISGLAFGTDILVHKSTYQYEGKTIAVMPSSIFEVQPKSHQKEYLEVLNNYGVIVSEYYDDKRYNKSQYINRNRIISGLSNWLIITECEEKSGTMHTARFAWKQKRKIFCFNNESTGIQKILNSGSATIYNGVNDLN